MTRKTFSKKERKKNEKGKKKQLVSESKTREFLKQTFWALALRQSDDEGLTKFPCNSW